jgi:hypothetical protein
MVKRTPAKPATIRELRPDEPLALVVATGYARQATISLARCEHLNPGTVRVDHAHLCDAEAALSGALEIVRAHKDRLAVRL